MNVADEGSVRCVATTHCHTARPRAMTRPETSTDEAWRPAAA